MLVSVESLIPLLKNPDSTLLRASNPVPDIFLPWKQRSRVRRILNALRMIRRTNPALEFEYYRQRTDIFVHIPKPNHQLIFNLVWPQHLPNWQTINEQDLRDLAER